MKVIDDAWKDVQILPSGYIRAKCGVCKQTAYWFVFEHPYRYCPRCGNIKRNVDYGNSKGDLR